MSKKRAKILAFPGLITRSAVAAPAMLRNIAKQKPDDAFVIVWPGDGGLPTYHSSTEDMPVILMRLQEFVHKYYSGDFEA